MFEVVKAKAHDLSSKAMDATVLLIIAAIGIGGIGMPIFMQTNKTGWDTTTATVWPYIPVIVIAGIVIGAVYMFKRGAE